MITFCPASVRLSVRPFVHSLHFGIFRQNHKVNFNQPWDKASLCEGDSSLLKLRARLSYNGRELGSIKISYLLAFLKTLLENHFARTTETCVKNIFWKGKFKYIQIMTHGGRVGPQRERE